MSMAYIRDTYSIPAKRGARVRVKAGKSMYRRGVVTSATHYLYVRLDGDEHARLYHPLDVEFIAAPPQGAA